MKRTISIISFILCFFISGAQQLDSLRHAALNQKISEYFGALIHESIEVQKAEADYMIEAASDSLVRQAAASAIYEHYVASPLMGAESVAIHVFDKWFRTGKVRMYSDMDFLTARIFADFNRQSLLGEKAPELVMESSDGDIVSLFGPSDPGGQYRILFFYDSGCAKCKAESILLGNMLSTEDFPVDFYAIYASDNREAWYKYIEERFKMDPGQERVFHLWDPELDSDFQRKYGVIQTPRMFLVSPDGIIIGRGLDTRSLSKMLHDIFDEVKLEYGGKESVALFDGIFAAEEGGPDKESVMGIVDYIRASTLEKGDTLMFRQLSGDMLYYLASRSGEGFKEGMDYLIDTNILPENKVWKSSDDSLKVVGFAGIMDDMLSKSAPGTKITDMRLPGVRLSGKREKAGSFRLNKLRGVRNIIIFYTDGCHICDAEKTAARALAASDRKVQVLMVNVDQIISSAPSLASRLFDSFDLSSLPFIIETDSKGTILRRYMTLQ